MRGLLDVVHGFVTCYTKVQDIARFSILSLDASSKLRLRLR